MTLIRPIRWQVLCHDCSVEYFDNDDEPPWFCDSCMSENVAVTSAWDGTVYGN